MMMTIRNIDTAPVMKTRLTKPIVSEETSSGAELLSASQEI